MNMTGVKGLQKGEVVLYYPQAHWFRLIKPVLFLAVFLVLFLILFLIKEIAAKYIIESVDFVSTVNRFYKIGALTIVIVAVIYSLREIIDYYLVRYSVTNKRLILKKGAFTSSLVDLPIEKVEGIICVQSLLGRVFDYGTIVVSGVGGMLPRFSVIRRPYKVRKILYDTIDKNKNITIIREDLPKPVFIKEVKPTQREPEEAQYGIFVTSYPAGEREVVRQ
jgi:membrane protein YdbS with pleckstrin-like domain